MLNVSTKKLTVFGHFICVLFLITVWLSSNQSHFMIHLLYDVRYMVVGYIHFKRNKQWKQLKFDIGEVRPIDPLRLQHASHSYKTWDKSQVHNSFATKHLQRSLYLNQRKGNLPNIHGLNSGRQSCNIHKFMTVHWDQKCMQTHHRELG